MKRFSITVSCCILLSCGKIPGTYNITKMSFPGNSDTSPIQVVDSLEIVITSTFADGQEYFGLNNAIYFENLSTADIAIDSLVFSYTRTNETIPLGLLGRTIANELPLVISAKSLRIVDFYVEHQERYLIKLDDCVQLNLRLVVQSRAGRRSWSESTTKCYKRYQGIVTP